MHQTLNPDELKRYQRHICLSQMSEAGQLKLKNAKVLCVGAGGLAAPVLYYLAAAGVGTLGIVDADNVDISNLQRQILYTNASLGQPKVLEAKARLIALNPHIDIETYQTYLNENNIRHMIRSYDVIVDATDNYSARYLINDACFYEQKPMVYAGIYQFDGQVSVFNYADSPCYRCLYPAPPPAGLMQNCAEAGVLGVLPGLLGSIQATETLKILLALGESLAGRLLTVDTLSMQFNQYPIHKNPHCDLCAHNKDFLSLPFHQSMPCDTVEVINVDELHQLYQTNIDFYLLDVRQLEEYRQGHLPNCHHIPLGHLDTQLHQLPKDKPIVVYCHHDSRSQYALHYLKQQGFTRTKYLKSGIVAWYQQGLPL